MKRAGVIALGCLLVAQAAAEAQGTRDVTYGPRTIVPIQTKVRFTTLIVLPEHEEILDFVCGDKDFWVVSGAQNLAYVKPAKAGASTNLNLVTSTGTIYSFLLEEGSREPDLKVYVTLDESARAAVGAPPKFYSAAQVGELRAAADEARRQAQEARTAAAQAVEDAAAAKLAAERELAAQTDAFRASYPGMLRFPYRFQANRKPFYVSAIFHDGRFTYIRTEATELPSLYEEKDGQPNLVTFRVEDGLYIVPKILERGYLTIGKQKFPFEMER
jgi:type IV secretion system protein VirB9